MEKKYLLAIIFVLILIVLAILIVPKPYNQTGFQSDVIAQNLQVPWAIDFLPNNTMIFTQRDGEVKIIESCGI